MSPKRLRLILIASIAGLVLLFIIICFVGMSKLSAKSQSGVNLKLQSAVLDDQITTLGQAKKQIQAYSYIKNVAAEIIPQDKDQAQAVIDINQIAAEAGIAIQNISFPSSTLGIEDISTSALLSQAKPVNGIPGLYSVELTITPAAGATVPSEEQVTYDKMLEFLSLIESNERTAQITQVTVTPGGSNNGTATSFTFSLNINVFIKP